MNFCRSIRIIRNRGCLSCDGRHYSVKSKAQVASTSVANDAEKVIGYPASFLSLRWLLKNEIADVGLQLRKLLGTGHPLLFTARDLILNKQWPTWGLIVLLMSKAGGIKKEFSQDDYDITAGILHTQQVLADVTDMIRTSNIIHKCILNTKPGDADFDDLHFGNKVSLLAGDYLLCTISLELAGIKDHDVSELIYTAVRDLSEVQFIEPTDKENRPLPAAPLKEQKHIIVPNQNSTTDLLKTTEVLGNAKAEWTLRHILDGASLLAKSCQATLMLAGHPEHFHKLGYLFGRNMALTWQAHKDQEIFERGRTDRFSLVCAPVLFHIQHDPSYHKKIMEYAENDDVDFYDIREAVLSGPGLQKTAELQEEFALNALQVLDEFPDNEARTVLGNIINSL